MANNLMPKFSKGPILNTKDIPNEGDAQRLQNTYSVINTTQKQDPIDKNFPTHTKSLTKNAQYLNSYFQKDGQNPMT